jgi:ATP-dependent helicase IRC3
MTNIDFSLLRSAKWRKLPASEQQKSFIARRWAKKAPVIGAGEAQVTKEERLANLTKGEAANIITRLKHGAQVEYSFSGCLILMYDHRRDM